MHRVQDEVLGGLWQLRCTRSLCRTYDDWILCQVPLDNLGNSGPIATSGPPRFVIPTSQFIGEGRHTEEPVFDDYMTTNSLPEQNNAPSLGHHTHTHIALPQGFAPTVRISARGQQGVQAGKVPTQCTTDAPHREVSWQQPATVRIPCPVCVLFHPPAYSCRKDTPGSWHVI